MVKANVYDVPLNNNGLAPKLIPVTHYEGEEASQKAALAFQTLHFQPNQHPATASFSWMDWY